jgi:hypothetical protein
MGQSSSTIKESMIRNIEFEYGGDKFLTSDNIMIYSKCIDEYKLPTYLPQINGLKLCTEDDISDFMNNDNRIIYINNKQLPFYDEFKTCNICLEYVNEKYYYVPHCINPSGTTLIDYNICLKCIDNNIIKDSEAYLIDETNNRLGNILEWVPLYKDNEFNGILYNSNRHSKNYGRFSIWICDVNEKIGINILGDITLEEIKDEIEEYYETWKRDYQDNDWDAYYNCPLMVMTSIRNLEYHFG